MTMPLPLRENSKLSINEQNSIFVLLLSGTLPSRAESVTCLTKKTIQQYFNYYYKYYFRNTLFLQRVVLRCANLGFFGQFEEGYISILTQIDQYAVNTNTDAFLLERVKKCVYHCPRNVTYETFKADLPSQIIQNRTEDASECILTCSGPLAVIQESGSIASPYDIRFTEFKQFASLLATLGSGCPHQLAIYNHIKDPWIRYSMQSLIGLHRKPSESPYAVAYINRAIAAALLDLTKSLILRRGGANIFLPESERIAKASPAFLISCLEDLLLFDAVAIRYQGLKSWPHWGMGFENLLADFYSVVAGNRSPWENYRPSEYFKAQIQPV